MVSVNRLTAHAPNSASRGRQALILKGQNESLGPFASLDHSEELVQGTALPSRRHRRCSIVAAALRSLEHREL